MYMHDIVLKKLTLHILASYCSFLLAIYDSAKSNQSIHLVMIKSTNIYYIYNYYYTTV